MIKVDLVTGFLGAGKTTFLTKYARYLMSQGEHIGILVYDCGSMNIDMVLLGKLRGAKCDVEMVANAYDEDCLLRRFKTKLISLWMNGYDRVIVEPSGVFDMDRFFDTLREDPLENWYEIGNVITIVNSKNEGEYDEESSFFRASQAVNAGIIVLSRTQMATKEEIQEVKASLAQDALQIRCNDFSPIYMEKNWDELTMEDWDIISKSGYHIRSYAKQIAGGATSYSSVGLLDVPFTLEELQQKIQQLFATEKYGKIKRIKGFIFNNGKNLEINATPSEMNITESNVGQNTLVIIGINLNKTALEDIMGAKS